LGGGEGVPPDLRLQAGAEGLEAGSPEHQAEVARLVAAADAIFCTTPATAPLFPARDLIESGRSSFVTAIGSYKPHMLELDPELLKYAAGSNKHVIVDTREGVLEEAGEVIQGGISAEQLLELGELFDAEEKGFNDSAREKWLQTQ
jgi:ornithine cyclodeaminase/alanine dehydrogenase-like protein (mu-crystallin family)